MKIDRKQVSIYKRIEEEYGTKKALENFQFAIAFELLRDLGASAISVNYQKKIKKTSTSH